MELQTVKVQKGKFRLYGGTSLFWELGRIGACVSNSFKFALVCVIGVLAMVGIHEGLLA
jgi:hypothetical protein